MSGFNQVILLGRLVAPPEELKTKSGKLFLRAVIATNVYSRSADVFLKYVSKGDLVHLVGRLDSREYKTDSGEKRLSLGLIVEQLHLLPNERKNADEAAGEGP
jgi:single-stranded DNA-binding protein